MSIGGSKYSEAFYISWLMLSISGGGKVGELAVKCIVKTEWGYGVMT